MPLIMVPRLSTVDEPFSFRSLISVTLSPSASSAPLESLTLMSMRWLSFCDERLRLFSLPLVGRVAHRERSERCDGWGVSQQNDCSRTPVRYPHPASASLGRPSPQGA